MTGWMLSFSALLLVPEVALAQTGDVMNQGQADLAQQTAEEIIAGAESAHPAALYVLTSKLMGAGRLDEAVRWFYIGQLRYRFYLMTNPPDVSDAGILFSALSESVGRPINEYAFGDVDGAVRQIDAALAWDEAHPNHFTSKDAHPAQLATVRDGLIAMRDDMIARKQEIKETRTRNGLSNR